MVTKREQSAVKNKQTMEFNDKKGPFTRMLHIHTSNIKYHKHMKQTLTKLNHKQNNAVTVGDFRPLLSIMNISVRLKINKETEDLSNIKIDQMDLTGSLKHFILQGAEFIFSKHTSSILQNQSHVRSQRSLNKSKRIEVISSTSHNCSEMKLKSTAKEAQKFHKDMEIKHYTFNNQRVKEETEKTL